MRKSIYDAGEYADSTSFDIEVLNPTKKTIKYVWISVTGYNAVNDPVRDRFKGGPMITVKGVGPIEPETTGSYTWKYMWRTTLVQHYKINEIKVQYMDGSTRSIKNIRAIELDKETMLTVEENS